MARLVLLGSQLSTLPTVPSSLETDRCQMSSTSASILLFKASPRCREGMHANGANDLHSTHKGQKSGSQMGDVGED